MCNSRGKIYWQVLLLQRMDLRVYSLALFAGELDSESERDRDVGMLEPMASLSDRGESPLVTPLSAQALRRWDARSASQLSISTDGTHLDEAVSRSNQKKHR